MKSNRFLIFVLLLISSQVHGQETEEVLFRRSQAFSIKRLSEFKLTARVPKYTVSHFQDLLNDFIVDEDQRIKVNEELKQVNQDFDKIIETLKQDPKENIDKELDSINKAVKVFKENSNKVWHSFDAESQWISKRFDYLKKSSVAMASLSTVSLQLNNAKSVISTANKVFEIQLEKLLEFKKKILKEKSEEEITLLVNQLKSDLSDTDILDKHESAKKIINDYIKYLKVNKDTPESSKPKATSLELKAKLSSKAWPSSLSPNRSPTTTPTRTGTPVNKENLVNQLRQLSMKQRQTEPPKPRPVLGIVNQHLDKVINPQRYHKKSPSKQTGDQPSRLKKSTSAQDLIEQELLGYQ